jgi:hypothetical protein
MVINAVAYLWDWCSNSRLIASMMAKSAQKQITWFPASDSLKKAERLRTTSVKIPKWFNSVESNLSTWAEPDAFG